MNLAAPVVHAKLRRVADDWGRARPNAQVTYHTKAACKPAIATVAKHVCTVFALPRVVPREVGWPLSCEARRRSDRVCASSMDRAAKIRWRATGASARPANSGPDSGLDRYHGDDSRILTLRAERVRAAMCLGAGKGGRMTIQFVPAERASRKTSPCLGSTGNFVPCPRVAHLQVPAAAASWGPVASAFATLGDGPGCSVLLSSVIPRKLNGSRPSPLEPSSANR